MLRRYLPFVFALLGAVPLAAQESDPADPAPPVQRWPARDAASPPRPQDASGDTGAPPAGRSAQRRAESPGQAAEPPAAPAPAAAGQRRRPQGRDRDDGEPRVAVPRERGAAPRPGGRPDADGRPRPGDGPRVYAPRPPARGYYDPRYVYPYGYGALGLGYYDDPYLWDRRAHLQLYGPGPYGSGYYGRGYTYDIGEVRLRVTPRDAQVFVDGYYAGVVDDYDGVLQALRLESGPYHIKMVAPGYEPLEVDIRVSPGQRVTYRGELRSQP